MVLFTRVEARDFLALFGRCISGRPRGPAPPLVIRFSKETRTLASTTGDNVMLTHASPAPGERDDLLVLPGSVLAEVEGSTDEGVRLDRKSKLRGVLDWHGRSHPRTLPIELILPGKQHELPEPPPLSSVSPRFLSALHECGRTSAKNDGRFALSRIQIQGKAGRIVGTNGVSALLWGGFTLPFAEKLLVPSIAVFGSKPLTRVDETSVGRTETHLVIAAGPWSVWLPLDGKSRYPDVAGVIPLQSPTVVKLDEQDVKELLKVLPTLPGKENELQPVTIDVEGSMKIRAASNRDGTREVVLRRSSVTGVPATTAIDRRVLARALSLGCHMLKLTPQKPIVFQGDGLSFVAVGLDADCVVPAVAETPRGATNAIPKSEPTPPNPERRTPMPSTETNGHSPTRGESPDPLTIAEEVRDALADTLTKANRLVAVLKAGRKEKKVLATVFAGLKQLNLNTTGSS